MKHTVVTKFIAIFLAACALATLVIGAIGIMLAGDEGLYNMDTDAWGERRLEHRADFLADQLAQRYAAKAMSNCNQTVLEKLGYATSNETLSRRLDIAEDSWGYRIAGSDGTVLESANMSAAAYEYTCWVRPGYPVDVGITNNIHQYSDYYYDEEGQPHGIDYASAPGYTVTVTLAKSNAYFAYDGAVVQLIYVYRYVFIGLLIAGFMVFAICMVYLCCAAGRSDKGAQAAPGGLNRMPLDVYAIGAGILCFGLMYLIVKLLESWFSLNKTINIGAIVLAAALFLVIAVIAVGFLFAIAAQCKVHGLYWWRHSVIGWCCGKLWRGLRLIGKGLRALFAMLPLIWQWLLIGAALGFGLLISTIIAMEGAPFFWVVMVLVGIATICYGGYAFGSLLKGAGKMAEGELSTKVSTRYLTGAYRRCAEHLNALADVATVAAKKQLRSDRMKTELITNVSHDIKTPLTSIINYVDLLQNTDDSQQRQQYLEVLSRQSQRMKKLIEDLMDMSKATTGNMAMEITQVDAVEAVTQALGEFADKLAAANLTPVFRQSAETIAMLADGRLIWRVLSNLLSNAVKYALPGTRIYVDLVQINSRVLISLKNISREELNISADELTERFVRGDASRNTEGSGLGLNIAKSLMELQHGSLELLVDGDLFKVTLCLPAA